VTAVKTKIIGIAMALAVAFGVTANAADMKGLRGSAVNEADIAPPIHRVIEGVKLERAYRQQPPLVPHNIDKYEIDMKVNQCLRCHEWPYSDQEKAPKISDLHYIDGNGLRRDNVNGNRYFCKQCHVPQNDAKPLVENRFQPAAAR
jgi:cytochrome c-type protein NapB